MRARLTLRPLPDAAMPEYKTIEDAIGDTPLVRLQRLPGAAQRASAAT